MTSFLENSMNQLGLCMHAKLCSACLLLVCNVMFQIHKHALVGTRAVVKTVVVDMFKLAYHILGVIASNS